MECHEENCKEIAETEETALVISMIHGDMDAFDRLMKIYQPKALRVAYLISGSYADSEDIVQETFVACYLNRQEIKNPKAFKSWFYKTLSRNAWRVCRRQNRETPTEEVYKDGSAAPGEVLKELIMREEETLIYEAIRSLPVKHRTILVLYYYNEMSIKEIAKACGCLDGTVKSRLYHGKQKLKEILKQQESEGGTAWTILS